MGFVRSLLNEFNQANVYILYIVGVRVPHLTSSFDKTLLF